MHCIKVPEVSVTFRSSICDLQQILQDFWAATVLWSIWRAANTVSEERRGQDGTGKHRHREPRNLLLGALQSGPDQAQVLMIMTSGPLIFFLETVSHTSGWSQSFGNPPASAPHPVTESTGIRAPLPTLAPQCHKLWLLSGFHLRPLTRRMEWKSQRLFSETCAKRGKGNDVQNKDFTLENPEVTL